MKLPSIEKSLPSIDNLDYMANHIYLEDEFEPAPGDEYTYFNKFNETGWTGLLNLDLVLSYGIQKGASDVHIAAGQEVAFTILGDIVKQTDFVIPDKDMLEDIQRGVLNNQADAIYVVEREYDTSYEIKFGPYKSRRFRVSIGKSFGADFLVFRTISDNIPSKESLGIEPEIEEWFENSSGAVLICGPTGSGKAVWKNTTVPMLNCIKTVGEVVVGDIIIDKDGNETKVLEIHRADESDRFYSIQFENGEIIKATGRHDWLIINNKGLLSTVSTDWLYNNRNESKLVIPRKFTPVEYINNIYKEERKSKLESLLKKSTGENIYYFKDKSTYEEAVLLSSSLGYWTKRLNEEELLIDRKNKSKGFSIKSIEPIEDNWEDYYCFEVDSPSHSYMISNMFLPTHNSTTMSSILRDIQLHQSKKIITIEKPIEAVYPPDGKSMVIQRAVPDDCLTFENGLTGAMRQNPDYILIGEVRNNLEVSEFLRAAETGHLAMSTIHTVNNVTTLNRIRSLFEGNEQKRILATLGDVLRGIMNQALVKTKDGKSRFAVREILTIDYKIRKLIAEDRFDEIRQYQEENRMTMEHKLCEAYISGKCHLKEARSKAPDQIYFDHLLENVYGY